MQRRFQTADRRLRACSPCTKSSGWSFSKVSERPVQHTNKSSISCHVPKNARSDCSFTAYRPIIEVDSIGAGLRRQWVSELESPIMQQCIAVQCTSVLDGHALKLSTGVFTKQHKGSCIPVLTILIETIPPDSQQWLWIAVRL